MTYGKVLHTEQHGERIVNVRHSSELCEYRCRLYVYGKANKDADYFTNDLDDAKSTAKAMATLRPQSRVVETSDWELLRADGRPVRIGDKLEDFRGDTRVVRGGEPPLHEGSTGRVDLGDRIVYPGVVDCKWVRKTAYAVEHVPADDTEGGAL